MKKFFKSLGVYLAAFVFHTILALFATTFLFLLPAAILLISSASIQVIATVYLVASLVSIITVNVLLFLNYRRYVTDRTKEDAA